MEKRVVFRSAWLPYALLAPQIAVTVVFFFWPAAQAVWYSFLLQDAFGSSTQFVWFENYRTLFADSHYYESFKVTAVFSVLVAASRMVLGLHYPSDVLAGAALGGSVALASLSLA